ncbi:hypothetical protein ACN9MB_13645 [Dyella kyungheensis]|uniref:hypothetical protein n=1 Tax=Dyella kyungheensis TaxID=1242174 RepID=UPI003CF3EBAB
MADVVGLHQGVHYEATYREQGESALWSATLMRGNELMLAEGSVSTTGTDCLDVSVLVHFAVQRRIEDFFRLMPLSGQRPRQYASGG